MHYPKLIFFKYLLVVFIYCSILHCTLHCNSMHCKTLLCLNIVTTVTTQEVEKCYSTLHRIVVHPGLEHSTVQCHLVTPYLGLFSCPNTTPTPWFEGRRIAGKVKV